MDISNNHLQLKFVQSYHNESKIMAITYFLEALAILKTIIAITHCAIPRNRRDRTENNCISFALKLSVHSYHLMLYLKSILNLMDTMVLVFGIVKPRGGGGISPPPPPVGLTHLISYRVNKIALHM